MSEHTIVLMVEGWFVGNVLLVAVGAAFIRLFQFAVDPADEHSSY